MKIAVVLVFFIAIYLIYGIYVSQHQISVLQPELSARRHLKLYDYRGVTHVHTHLSTGSGSPQEVIAAGLKTDLDFLILTDLNHFDKPYHLRGYHEKLLVMLAGEYSYLDSRLLYYDVPADKAILSHGNAQVRFADQLSQQRHQRDYGFLTLAHPYMPGYKWSGEFPPGLDAIEVINLKSIWAKAARDKLQSFFWSFLLLPFNPQLALVRLYQNLDEEIRLWDRLNQKRRVVGLAGNDTTAKAILFEGRIVRFPNYSDSFELISNHIILRSELTGHAHRDRQKIISALKSGQFYMSLDFLGDPTGFLAIMDDGKQHLLGAAIQHSRQLKLKIELPSKPRVPFEIRVFRNGQRFHKSSQTSTIIGVPSPGQYRVSVHVSAPLPFPEGHKWMPWIMSNPFYVD